MKLRVYSLPYIQLFVLACIDFACAGIIQKPVTSAVALWYCFLVLTHSPIHMRIIALFLLSLQSLAWYGHAHIFVAFPLVFTLLHSFLPQLILPLRTSLSILAGLLWTSYGIAIPLLQGYYVDWLYTVAQIVVNIVLVMFLFE